MTIIESLTLMCALVYSISLLYSSGKKLGASITFGILVLASVASLYWPLMLSLGLAVIVMVVVHRYQPEVLQGNYRPNTLRYFCQHAMALSFFFVAIHTALLTAQISLITSTVTTIRLLISKRLGYLSIQV